MKLKDYLDKIAEQANMEVIISATVAKENNNKDNIVKVDNFRLQRADIVIKVSYLILECSKYDLGIVSILIFMWIFEFIDAH